MRIIGWSIVAGGSLAIAGLSWWLYRESGYAVGSSDDKVGKDKVVPGDPVALASRAGVPIDVYALARLGPSEESGEAGMTAVMWAARNMATKRGESIHALLLRGGRNVAKKFVPSISNGKFGGQETGKYADTKARPTALSLRLAAAVMAKSIPDPTGGATQWDAPKAQARAHAKDPKKWKTPEEVAAKRIAAGAKMTMVAGVPNTRFWRAA